MKKNQVLIRRRRVKSLNTGVKTCHVTSEILIFFPDNGTDHEKLCKPLIYIYVGPHFGTSPVLALGAPSMYCADLSTHSYITGLPCHQK